MPDNDARFVALLEKSKSRLYYTALAILTNDAGALEAVDETIYRSYMAFPKLRDESLFGTWITRVLVNVCRDELRRRKRRGILPDDAAAPTVDDDELIALKAAVNSLPEKEREVVILRYYMQYTIAETAAVTGMPDGTVSTTQRRALEILREKLGGNEREQ